jgi:hypothetical protein
MRAYTMVAMISGAAFALNLLHAHEKASPMLYSCPAAGG